MPAALKTASIFARSIAAASTALRDGSGTMALGSGAFEGQYSYSSRFEEGTPRLAALALEATNTMNQ